MTGGRSRGKFSVEQIEAFYKAVDWTEDNLSDLVQARVDEHAGKVFVTDGTHSLTYGELYRDSHRLAVGLRRRGIVAGDRVAVQLPNWSEFILIATALARIGAVMVPIMPIYRRAEVGHVVDDASIRMIIGSDGFKGVDYLSIYESIRAESDTLQMVAVVRAAEDSAAAHRARGIDRLEDLLPEITVDEAAAELDHRTHPDDLFVIVYTSGTTSRPKGCVHTFNTYAATARALAAAFETTEADVQLGSSPITHTTGLVTNYLLPLMAGASTHLVESWDPAKAVKEVATHRCTSSVSATVFLQTLIAAAEQDPAADLSSLRQWVCAGAPIPAAVVEEAALKHPGIRVLSLYGRSENLVTTTCAMSDEPRRAVESDGRACPGVDVRVIGPDGREVPRGEEGDVAYRGASHMIGYLGRPDATDELYTDDGFSRSGDLGKMDEDGFVRITGRTKDIIIRGGMNISAREIEDKLVRHPAIGNLAVVSMPDERLGEKVCLFLVAAEGHPALTVDEVRQYLLDNDVAIQKTPERVVVVDSLPTTATGKIQKNVLRDTVKDMMAREATASA